jgi:glycosyltransferase involved in cell wall biosynthesis
MKVLQICSRVPFPPHDGGAIAMFDVCKGLSEAGHDVHVLAVNTPKHFQPHHVLEKYAKLTSVFINTSLSPWKAFLNLFKTLPYNVERFVSTEFETVLKALLQKENFDVIQIEGTFVAYYIDVIKSLSQVPVVLRAHNVEYVIWERLAKNEKNRLKKIYLQFLTQRLKKFEVDYFKKFDAIAGITQEDCDRIKALGISVSSQFIPAGVDLARFVIQPDIKSKPNTLFIISSLNWLPNLEGLEWFMKEVWPKAKAQNPNLELHIAGKDTPEHVKALAGNGIVVDGFVPDASVFMQQYDLMLVPLLSGGGMRLKIIEGMALGKAILTTQVGAEGIACQAEVDILLHDKPERWVATILNYFEHKERYQLIGTSAYTLIQNEYDNKRIIQKLENLYNSLKQIKC